MIKNYSIVPKVWKAEQLSQYGKKLTGVSELLFKLIGIESINSHSKFSLELTENTPFFYITKTKLLKFLCK